MFNSTFLIILYCRMKKSLKKIEDNNIIPIYEKCTFYADLNITFKHRTSTERMGITLYFFRYSLRVDVWLLRKIQLT